MFDIGEKLRAARLGQNLSLRELAEKAEVSASLLSQIENGKANPSVRSLYSIAAALALPTNHFFPDDSNGDKPEIAEAGDVTGPLPASTAALVENNDLFQDSLHPPKGPLVGRAKRTRIELTGGVIWERLTPGREDNIEFMEICYEVGASSGEKMSRHTGREFGLMLAGELVVELGFDKYLLQVGDSIVFDSTTPHRMVNPGQVQARAVWVVIDRG